MTAWRIGLLNGEEVVFWTGTASSAEDAEAQALEAYPGAVVKSGTEL